MSNLLVQNIKHTNNTQSIAVDTSGNVTASGTMAVDTIKGNASAGSMTIVGEGGSNTTNIQQGLAKVFSSFAHESGTPTAKDTFNISSYADSGVGVAGHNYTNNMSVANHCVVAMANYRDSSAQVKNICRNENTSFSTSSHATITVEQDFTVKDSENTSSTAHGDLA